MEKLYSLNQFVQLFDPRAADKQVNQMFTAEFREPRGGQCGCCFYKTEVTNRVWNGLFITRKNSTFSA